MLCRINASDMMSIASSNVMPRKSSLITCQNDMGDMILYFKDCRLGSHATGAGEDDPKIAAC
jgi:hypothetical protein